jgi:transcriptional regulator with XRE-family HTH domain
MMYEAMITTNVISQMKPNDRLRIARVLARLTQLQLANMVGLKESDISRIETGRTVANCETKERIARALDKPAFELFQA